MEHSGDRNETKHKYKSVFLKYKKYSKQVYGRGRVIGSLVYVL